MKSSLKKLRGLALHNHKNNGEDRSSRNSILPLAQLDEIAQATQDMEDMRDCYDTLLSAAAATANSAYEFAESLRDMGTCLLEKTALQEYEDETGKVLLMLGKMQFKLQKLIDNYRSHVFQTITIPSESLLNELRIVELRQPHRSSLVFDVAPPSSKPRALFSGLRFLSSAAPSSLSNFIFFSLHFVSSTF